MRSVYSHAVKEAMKVKKGDVRNTVLRHIKRLEESVDYLTQGKSIKEKEYKEFKGENKGNYLRKQIDIIENGIGHIKGAIKELKEYKDVTVT